MKHKNNKSKFNSYAPFNQENYKRNLNKSKKLYMDEYDRLKQQIYKRRQDREFHEVLSNYYNDFNKLSKKHPFLKNNQNFIKPKQQETFDYNQYEMKKKNINALFFKYDNSNNDLNFDFTDELINSMNDGNNKSFLNSFEIKQDYNKRLALYKKNEIKNEIETDTNNTNLYSLDKNINLSIISDQKQRKTDDKINQIKNVPAKQTKEDEINKNNNSSEKQTNQDNEIQNNLIIENYQDINDINNKQKIQLENKKEELELNEIKEEQEDELARYKKYLKENKFPCFEDFINPFNKTNFIPPVYIPEEPESEKNESESKKISEYNDFENIEENKNENESNLKKSSVNKDENAQLPNVENIINSNSNIEYPYPRDNNFNNLGNEKKEENKEENKEEDNYEDEKFDDIIDIDKNNNDQNNDRNPENENKSLKENKKSEKINEYNNGELKMIDDIIKDDNHPQFEQIINPYYQTNYKPPDVFIKPETQDFEQPLATENKETNSHIETPELALANDLDKKHKDEINKIEDNIQNNDNIYAFKESFIKNSSNENDDNHNIDENLKEDDNNRFRNNEEENGNSFNDLGINNGNQIIPVEQMINPGFQPDNAVEEEIKEENGDEEFNDFEVS